jgi:mannitol/fructose-specific phosphotransferase system IIA component (Ntr-type)
MMQQTTLDTMPDLRSVFTADCVESFPTGTSKNEALRLLVDSLARNGHFSADKATLVANGLIERERLGTTGMGKGLAMPHMRSRNVVDFVGAVGVAPQGIEFDSLDGLPARLVILLISPFDLRQQHCWIMGKIASLLSNRTLQYSLQVQRSPNTLLEFLGFR